MQKILLVEDDSTLAMGIEYSLKNEGYDVDVAHNVEGAKKLIDSEEYDLILLDVMLPDGDGFQLCKYLRREQVTPIIFLTAKDEEVNVVMGLDIGGDDYITKPFRIKELMSRIKAVLRRAAKSSHKHLLISGEIAVDLREGTLYIKKERVFLTPSEYKLLTILMEHSNQVLSRTKVLENLWDVDGDFIDDNTLSVYISRLRDKIEKDSSNPLYIKTVRGVGYRWDIDVRGE